MKLSRRGKHAMHTRHTRRGKYTKLVRKHHTRRIKHRGKQYKKTYRKNNRKLKHNKRIQRGGVTGVTVVTWSGDDNTKRAKVMLTYKKNGELITFGDGEVKPFEITLTYNGRGNDGRSNFTVTMKRMTTREKNFTVYFKLGEFTLYFSQTGNEFEDSDANIFLQPGERDTYKYCRGASLTFTTSDVNNTETYVFPCNSMNLDFFRSLESQIRSIINRKKILETANAKNASDQNIRERERQIEDGDLDIYFTTGPNPVNYVKFTTELREKVDSIKNEITLNKLYDKNKKRSLIMNLENIESRILAGQLKSMKTALTDIEDAKQQQAQVQILINSLESFRPNNDFNVGAAMLDRYASQDPKLPIEYETHDDGKEILDARGNPIPKTTSSETTFYYR